MACPFGSFFYKKCHPIGRHFLWKNFALGRGSISIQALWLRAFLAVSVVFFFKKKAPSSSKKPLAKELSFPFSPSRFLARVFLISHG
jgi:hypothetical protein